MLAIDQQQEWMLNEQFGEDLDEQDGESQVSDYLSILKSLPLFQRKCSSRLNEFYSASCRYKGVTSIRMHVLEAMSEPRIRDLVDSDVMVGSDVMAAIHERLPTIKQIFRSFENLRIPDTLFHGDLW